MPEPKLYEFSTHVGSACARQMVSFHDLAEKLKMDVTDLMKQCNAKPPIEGRGGGPRARTGNR
jgi:hypothetical protein